MDLTGTLVKTAKGVNEIQTRANRLAQKKRNLLILIDGNIGVEAMVARFPSLGDIRQTLLELVDEGYAEIRGTSSPLASTVAAAPSKPAADAAGFANAVRALSRNLYDLIGPTADAFTSKLEAARDRGAFLQALRSSVAIAESFAGKKKAEAFQQRAMEIADRHFPE